MWVSFLEMDVPNGEIHEISCWDDIAEVENNFLWQDLVVCLVKPTIVFFMLLLT